MEANTVNLKHRPGIIVLQATMMLLAFFALVSGISELLAIGPEQNLRAAQQVGGKTVSLPHDERVDFLLPIGMNPINVNLREMEISRRLAEIIGTKEERVAEQYRDALDDYELVLSFRPTRADVWLSYLEYKSHLGLFDIESVRVLEYLLSLNLSQQEPQERSVRLALQNWFTFTKSTMPRSLDRMIALSRDLGIVDFVCAYFGEAEVDACESSGS